VWPELLTDYYETDVFKQTDSSFFRRMKKNIQMATKGICTGETCKSISYCISKRIFATSFNETWKIEVFKTENDFFLCLNGLQFHY